MLKPSIVPVIHFVSVLQLLPQHINYGPTQALLLHAKGRVGEGGEAGDVGASAGRQEFSPPSKEAGGCDFKSEAGNIVMIVIYVLNYDFHGLGRLCTIGLVTITE